MSASGSTGLQKSATADSDSLSDDPNVPSNLQLICRILNIDEKLKLSHENFQQLIEEFYNNKDITPQSQLKTTPAFPTPYVLAQFANKSYTDYKKRETDPQYETRIALPDGWKLLTTASNNSKGNGYFGAAYWHPEHQQVVIAHRGTKPTKFGALWTDLVGVVFKHHVPQMNSASTFAHKVVEVLQEVYRIKGVSFQLFFTGHSLGGWLAQVTTFSTEYLKRVGNFFHKSNCDDYHHPHTVVFESPGCKDMLSKMRDTFDVRYDGRSIEIEHLDITSYLSAPNRINTCNSHLGTVCHIFTDLSNIERLTTVRGRVYWLLSYLSSTFWQIRCYALYTLATHSIEKLVQAFDPETGQVHKNEQGKLKIQVVSDWPISAGLRDGEECKKFFEWADSLNNYHPDITDESFPDVHHSQIRYRTKIYDEQVNSLHVFSQEEQNFLLCYLGLRECPKPFKSKELFSVIKDNQAQEEAEKVLQCFKVENDTKIRTDPSALRPPVPYVKRLLHLFPEIKDVGKRFWQCEINSCIEQMKQNPLDFNSDAEGFREFLNDKQQQVLQLQIVGGDEWAGLIKVYQVLQKTNCLIEGQYTVMSLERLLSLNMVEVFRKLMQSINLPYIMLVACEANQPLKDETKDMIKNFFETMKQKPSIKIILTRSQGRVADFLQDKVMKIFGSGFVRREEQLNLSDLTSSSQKKLMEKTVIFQGFNISLNKIMSAESSVAKYLPLCALLEEKELEIADPVPIADGYNEGSYIGRKLRCQRDIKEDIYSDKSVKELNVHLVSTEQEYHKLCEQNPKSNVHWLEKEESGKLVWQRSQGSLEKLREYIDTESSQTYTDDDLDKLLKQAQHQRVMVISGAAGMGKSNLLTHLSREIKQKFPAKWVARIDLNDHPDALKELKQKGIDKEKPVEKAIEFVSEKLLKLKPGLELELFKECCEQTQKLRIVIMLDGFDEIYPSYQEAVIGLLHALRQTLLESLWITTRPHLKEDLEAKLQQISYTLEPLSEENQVEYLTKFWSLKDWYTNARDKEKEVVKSKLEIYAEHLIKKLATSVRDKDKVFTGIPLQTRLLAEAFDEEVEKFYRSPDSILELLFTLDLVDLYGRFIERKYDIYQMETLQVPRSSAPAIEQRKFDFKHMREDHQLLALKVRFTNKQVAFFETNIERMFSDKQLTRFGIVKISDHGELHFIYPTLADYYVADCLVDRLTDEKNISQKLQTLILGNILRKAEYKMIRVFVDSFLSRAKPSEEESQQYEKGVPYLQDDVATEVQRVAREGDVSIVLERVVEEGDVRIVAVLFDSLKAAEHRDTLVQLLLEQGRKGKTAWINATEKGNVHALRILCEYAKDNLTKEEINQVLLTAGSNGMTAFHMAARWGKLDILQNICDWANETLTTHEINNVILATDQKGMTALHLAAARGKVSTFRKIWEWSIEKMTREEITNELLLATDCMGRTVCHIAAQGSQLEILQKIWEWAKENLTAEEISNKLLLGRDTEGKTVCHVAARWGKLDILLKIIEWAKENLTPGEINNKFLLATGRKGRTAWHVAAGWGKLEVLQKIWEWAKGNLTKEEINNKLLLATDTEGMTVCHVAAMWGKLDILLKIIEWAKENLTPGEISNKLLLATDRKGRTAWHVTAGWGQLEVLQKIWEWAIGNLTKEEINNKLLLATDTEGMSVCHVAAMWGKLDILLKIIEWAKENLTPEEINNKLLLATDKKGKTAWHVAADWDKLDVLQRIWQWANENITAEEINNKLLLSTDKKGKTAWHVAADWGKLDILQEIWVWANQKLTTEEVREKLLLSTDQKGRTTWHVAADWGKLEVLQKIWKWANRNLTTEEIRSKLLLATDNEGKTAWHKAAERGKLVIFQKIWEWSNDKLTTEELDNKLLLLATDNMGRTICHMAVLGGQLELLQKIRQWAKENLATEEINNKLLLATDNNGNTAGQVAEERNKVAIIRELNDWANECQATEGTKTLYC